MHGEHRLPKAGGTNHLNTHKHIESGIKCVSNYPFAHFSIRSVALPPAALTSAPASRAAPPMRGSAATVTHAAFGGGGS
jgi:hypothetical protein